MQTDSEHLRRLSRTLTVLVIAIFLLESSVLLLIMIVMLTGVKRDRDNVGTTIPVVIPTQRGEKRDGVVTRYEEVIDEEEGSWHQLQDLNVRMVPYTEIGAWLTGKVRRKGTDWQLDPEVKQALLRLVTLVEGTVTRNRFMLQQFVTMESDYLKELIPDYLDELVGGSAAQARKRSALLHAANALRTIGNEVNRRLGRVKFVIWWVEEQRHFAPGLLCYDLSTAVVALLVSRITASQNFAVCALPSCRRQFVRVKKNNRYCSRKCGDTHRKRLQRARLSRHQKKGTGYGSGKTR